MTSAPEFRPFEKIARYSREVIVTEKIDGTNAQIHVTEAGEVLAGCRTRWITAAADNHGFAAWVDAHRQDLLWLGPGSHYGEWWGKGINRGYGVADKRFSLFNVLRWGPGGKDEEARPGCCLVVPVLWRGPMDELDAEGQCAFLRLTGSAAAPGYRDPEGIVIFHVAGKVAFKKTLRGDNHPKSVEAGTI